MNLDRITLVFTLLLLVGCAESETKQPKNTTPQTAVESSRNNQGLPLVKSSWPFADSEDRAAITLTRILKDSKPILYVVHDADGDWQFLDGEDVTEADAATVSLKNIVDHDPSVKALADLPVGWAAERAGVGQTWKRSEQ